MFDLANEINKSERSTVRNMCPWTVSFTLPISGGSVLLGAYKKTSVNNEELISLIENSNIMFVGTGEGNHARIYVENEQIRKYVGFDDEESKKKQFVLNDDECQRILDYKTFATFKKHMEESVISNHEKAKIIEYARKIKVNDYEKIDYLESYCQMPFKKKE